MWNSRLLVHCAAQTELKKDEGPIGLVLCPTRFLSTYCTVLYCCIYYILHTILYNTNEDFVLMML